jgi:hypothetical protein
MSVLQIIDDFYPDPYSVRDFALNCKFKPSKDAWPGLQSCEMWPGTEVALMRIAKIVSTIPPNWQEIEAAYRFWGEAPCGGFQALLEDHPEPGTIHLHRRGQWTGLVYLSLPKDCEGRLGTAVFRHKRTQASSLLDIDIATYEVIKEDKKDHAKWEEIASADMVFNRLVLIDSRYFHT